MQGKGPMLTWWLVGKIECLSSVSLDLNRSSMMSPLQGKQPPKRAISDIVKDAQIKGTNMYSLESSIDNSVMKKTVPLPGSIVIEEF